MNNTTEARKFYNLPSEPLKDFILLHYPAQVYKGMLHVWAKQRKNGGRMYRYCYGSPLEVLEKVRRDRSTDRRQDYYITANVMSAGTRDKDNLFALHNIVIDLDNHTAGADPDKIRRQYDTITALYRFKTMDASGDYIPNTIVYTGRGVQLWYAIEQISYKRLDIYETLTGDIIRQVKELLQDNPDTLEGLTLDEGASHNAVGLFRAPWSYNRKAGTRADFTILHDCYIESMDEAKRIREQLKEAGRASDHYRTPTTNINAFAIKRQRSLEQLVRIRQGKGAAIRRNDILLCVSYVWAKICIDDMELIGHVKEVNRLFNTPMTNKEIQATLKTALVKRYTAKNSTIIEFLGITQEEREAINLYTAREEEREKQRKKKAARDKEVLRLTEEGKTQEDIAARLHISRRTVCNILERNQARKMDTGRLFEREAYTGDKTYLEPNQGENGAQDEATGACIGEPETVNNEMCKKRLYVADILPTPSKQACNRPEYLKVIDGGKVCGSGRAEPIGSGQDPGKLEAPETDRGSPGG